MKIRAARALATLLGCGCVPVAPGTAGSAVAVAIALAAGWPPLVWLALSAVLLPAAIWAAGVTAREAGREDPALIVVDELLGQWVTIAGATVWNWKAALAAFLLFRLLDIWKPVPARQAERLRGGAGILADDLVAGVYGALVMRLAGWFNLY